MESKRRPIDWVMVTLAVMVVSSPAFAMAVADWADGLDKLWLIALVGMAAGLAISVSRFRSLTAHGLNLVYSLAWIGFLLASPLPYVLWRDKILNLYARVAAWVALALRGGTGRDEMIFLLLLGLLFWWMGYTAIWNTVRHQRVWRALLPSGIVLLVNVYYYPGTKLTPYLMIYLLCALLVVVRSYTVLQEGRWANEHIGYSSDVRFDLLRSGLVLALAAILLAWVAPTAASSQFAYEMWQRVEGPWRRVEDDFNRMFSTLRSQSTVYGNPFGRTLTLRGPRNLADTPVLDIYAPPEKRFYWRGVVYDRYTGSGWINTDSDTLQLEAWREPQRALFDAREQVTQTITIFLPVNTLVFAAPEPQRIGLPVRADVRVASDGTVEVSQMISSKSLMRGATYTAVSSLSTADIEKLRGAGAAFPAGIRERYLQLPESLPSFVRRQAQDIAGNLATPYDKAAAIEAWLRANVVYDDQTPAPPQDQDGVGYILTVKRGYCDYYASAMVVMLRSLGVPARVAVGYTQGKYDSVSSIYHVTEKDSHSWVEVYFPKYGWVEFEPTASQPVIDRPKPQILSATPTPDSAEADGGTPRPRPTRDREGPEDADVAGGSYVPSLRMIDAWLVLGMVGAFIALVFAVMWIADRRKRKKTGAPAQAYSRWVGPVGLVELAIALAFAALWALGRLGVRGLYTPTQALVTLLGLVALAEILLLVAFVATRIYELHGLSGLSPAAQIYARLLRFSSWLRVRWSDSHTPRERGSAFASVAPEATGLIMRITDDYTREQYSPAHASGEESESVWQELSPQLWLAGLRLRADWFRRRWREFQLWRDSFSRRMSEQFN